MATGTASESLTFIFNSAGTIILQIPYTLYATSNSTGMITLNGSGSSSVSGNWSTTGGALTGTVSDSVSSATLPLNGPQTGPQTSSADLDVVLSNTSEVQADYTLNLAAVATANFSAPVPEVPTL